MEKFGIFNILSALGNLAEEKGETAKKEEESAPAPPAPAPAERAGIFTGEERMNKMLSRRDKEYRLRKQSVFGYCDMNFGCYLLEN